jgi:hypothetical protein
LDRSNDAEEYRSPTTTTTHNRKKIVDVAQWVDSYKSNNDMMAELSGKIVGMGVVRHVLLPLPPLPCTPLDLGSL